MADNEKEIKVDGLTFIIKKFSAIDAAEIISQGIPAALPKYREWSKFLEVLVKVFRYVYLVQETPSGGTQRLQLSTQELINNSLNTDYPFETMLKVFKAVAEHNVSFLADGLGWNLLTKFEKLAQQLNIKISPELSGVFSKAEEPHSTN